MKKLVLALIAFSVTLLCSCKREDLSAFIGSSMTDDVTNVTSDSFEFHGTFTLEGGVATSSAIGIFMDTKPGITSGQYFLSTNPVKMTNGATSFSYKFSNIDQKTNERIFKAGTTVYYRAYLRVTDTDYNTHTYVYGDEKSFTVPVSKCTLMVYGTGGGNLDYENAKNLLAPMMKEGRDGNLQVTFQYKPSTQYQKYGQFGQYNNFQGVQRWVMPYGTSFKDIWNENIETSENEAEYTIYAYNRFALFSQQVGDMYFNLSDPQNLTTFINWSMEKCPAEKYILLMVGRGSGWDLKNDGTLHAGTKGQIADDNLDDISMSIFDFTEGIMSSNVDMLDGIIFDESLMATLETMAAVSEVAENMLAPQGRIAHLRGYDIMNTLKNSSIDNYDTFKAFSKLVKNYCRDNSDKYTDLGAYDLKMTGNLLSSVAEASTFLRNRYLGSTDWKTIINKGISKTLWTFGSNDGKDYRSLIFGLKGKMESWEILSDGEKEQAVQEYYDINNKGYFQYCFFDFLSQTLKAAENFLPSALDPDFPDNVESLRGILSGYRTALKSMSCIDCGQKQTEDTPYEYTSPSICLQSLASGIYGPVTPTNLAGYVRADGFPRDKAIATYTALTFDSYSTWSDFLTQIQTSTAPFFSDDRQFRQSEQ